MVYGQTDTIPDQEITIYLKNGKFVHGYQTFSPFKGYLTIEIDEFTQKHIPYRKIRYILNGPPMVKPPPVYEPLNNTFFLSILVGIQYGAAAAGNNRATISFAAGYVFHPLLQTSVGLGFMQYDPVSTTSLFARIHGNLSERKWSPFYFAEAGSSRVHSSYYNVGMQLSDAQGGLMLHPGLGIQRRFRSGAVFFQLGYRIQRAQLEYEVLDFWGGMLQVQERLTFRRVTAHLGISF